MPEAGVTVTAICAAALETMLAGLAVMVRLVATWAAVLTVTVADPKELPK